MASISDLFTNFMRLVNLNFFTKTEANNRFALISDLTGKADSVHSHTNASSSSAGFMSTTDKSKLDGMDTVSITVKYTDGTTGYLNLYKQT